MNKEFIPYEQALALKELGFDEPCLAFYNGKNFLDSTQYDFDLCESTRDIGQCINAPLYKQAFRWFREKHGLVGWISSKTLDDGRIIYIPHGRTIPDTIKNNLIVDIITYFTSESYEEAELECLKKLIEIVKHK